MNFAWSYYAMFLLILSAKYTVTIDNHRFLNSVPAKGFHMFWYRSCVVNFGSSLSTQAFVIKESLDHLFSSTVYQNHVKVNIDDQNTTKVLTWTSWYGGKQDYYFFMSFNLRYNMYVFSQTFLINHIFLISFVFSLVKRVVSCFCVEFLPSTLSYIWIKV